MASTRLARVGWPGKLKIIAPAVQDHMTETHLKSKDARYRFSGIARENSHIQISSNKFLLKHLVIKTSDKK